MPGGLLNLVAYGNQNIILNGNPSKTFFKSTYAKYSNFGLQRFRLDFDGQRHLRMTDSSVFDFKVPRYADLLMDTYLVLNLPNKWSPICDINDNSGGNPFEFKWIENIGSQLIETVRFKVGGQVIQELTGQYMMNMIDRDFSNAKKDLYNRMTGNIAELNDPANSFGRKERYPSALSPVGEPYSVAGVEPSIRGRSLYIPLNIWFTTAAKMAFPLVSLQYSELSIEVTIRPIQDLFVVRKIHNTGNGDIGDYIRANQSDPKYGFYKFLHSPPPIKTQTDEPVYQDKRTQWNADVHLVSTYCFLSDDEIRIFASQPQKYLIKEIYTTLYENIVGTQRIDVKSQGMVSSYMWFLQRNDVYMRNEWSNYTNWEYKHLPANVRNSGYINLDGSGVIYETGDYKVQNEKEIMKTWGLILDGKYREDSHPVGIFNYIEKYNRTTGGSKDGLYLYNFCLNTDHNDFQPSGAMNMSKFTATEFELNTMLPVHDPNAEFKTICDEDGNVIGTIKPAYGIYDYTYNMIVMEERYNILIFSNGNAGLEFAR
jgi:hypothetical protein